MGTIFISYRSTDREFVLRLADDIIKSGGEVWLDVRQISGRKPYWNEIQDGVEQCSHFLFVISPDSIAEGSGALTELYHAAGLKPIPTIVPVLVRSVDLKSLPILISPGRYQIHDFAQQPYEVMLPRVLTALGLHQNAEPIVASKEKSNVQRPVIYGIISIIILAVVGGIFAIMANNNSTLSPTSVPSLALVSTLTSSTIPTMTASPTENVITFDSPTLMSPTNAPIATHTTSNTASSSVNSVPIQAYRSADSIAICAAQDLSSSALAVFLTGANENYLVANEFPGTEQMTSGQCVCLQRVEPRYPLPSVCSDNNTKQVGNKISDWRNTDVLFKLNGTVLGTCKAQPERSDVYDCFLK